jgi:hypothetical protein
MSVYHRATIALFSLATTLTLAPSAGWSQESIQARSESSIHLEIGDSVQSVQQALRVPETPAHTLGAGGTSVRIGGRIWAVRCHAYRG